MSTKSTDIAEFYQQLALLVKTELPLPDSIRELGATFGRDEFRRVLQQVSEETRRGEKLSVALARRPRYFEPFHVRLIETGEQSGALAEMLSEVAHFARMKLVLLNRLRELMAYPLGTVFIAFFILTYLLYFVIPNFGRMFDEMLPGVALPPLTQGVLWLSDLVCWLWLPVNAAFVCAIGFAIWLYSGSVAANAAFRRLIGFLPGLGMLARDMDYARLCSLLSVYLERQVPLTTALPQCAEVMELPAMRALVQSWARAEQQGRRLGDIVTGDDRADSLLAVTLRHSPEAGLSRELRDLAQLYADRVEMRRAGVTAVWEALLLLCMANSVGLVVLGMFMPLIKLIDTLGGD